MNMDDRNEIRAILDYVENLIHTVQQPVPRAVELVTLGACGMIRDILARSEPLESCDDACPIDGGENK